MGQAPAGASYNDRGEGVPLVAGAGDFPDGRVRAKKYTTAPTRLTRPGDIILGVRATIGVTAWADDVYCLGRGVAGLRPKAVLEPRYLWHWLSHARSDLERRGRGATFLQVNRKDIGTLEIPLPPIKEQRRIAAVLDQTDELRVKRRASVALFDSLREEVVLGAIAGADTLQLGEALAFLTSGARGWAKYYTDHGSRFIRSLDVRMGSMGNEAPVYVDAPNTAEARRIAVRTRDVLLTITGSLIGRVAVAPAEVDGAFISQHVAILRLDENVLVPEFAAAYLGLPSGGQRQIASSYYGQTKPGLNFEQIRGFEMPALSLADQERVVHMLSAVDSLQAESRQAEGRVGELFASLRHRAFAGQL